MSTTIPNLARANEVRCAHAAIKRYIRSTADGRDVVASLLEHPTGHVSTLRISYLLHAIRGMHRSEVDVLLDDRFWPTGIHPDRRIRELTDRQRRCIATRLRA